MRTVAGLMAAVVALTGCSAQRVETPTFDSAPTMTTAAPAVKYTEAASKSCLDLRQEVGADLPTPQSDTPLTAGNLTARSCIFKGGESFVYGVRSWTNTDDATGVKSGAEYATKYFTERTKAWEKDGGVGLGSDARWREEGTAGCALEILDVNIVLTVGNGTAADQDQCRTSVRELAKKFFAAVQP